MLKKTTIFKKRLLAIIESKRSSKRGGFFLGLSINFMVAPTTTWLAFLCPQLDINNLENSHFSLSSQYWTPIYVQRKSLQAWFLFFLKNGSFKIWVLIVKVRYINYTYNCTGIYWVVRLSTSIYTSWVVILSSTKYIYTHILNSKVRIW